MINGVSSVSRMTVKSKPVTNLVQVIYDTVKELGVDMGVAQARIRDARMSGIKLTDKETIKKVITGNFKNQMVKGVSIEPQTHGYDTVSYMRGNRNGYNQQYRDYCRAQSKRW